ncbi:hypothetical protein JS530_01285 [Bifidobacterium sp. LC6]|uniref:Uncharacterized protein n=1 Tax=Bifidobacterium colobi TaxID=2809026 RepID=A0ABS5UT59_9BIFI|nr:hypothetical protein [Bifidobacterium colobi]MBT1174160.1 hypothetical protein [Bifidobacterium colobi]
MIHPALQSQGNAEGSTPVVLLTGADRLSIDSVAFTLVDSCPSVCSISYDVRPNGAVESGLDIIRNIVRPQASGVAFGESDSFGLEECCLSCTVKHDLERVLESLCGRAGVFLVSLPVGLEAAPIAQYLADSFRINEWGESMFVGPIANAVGLDEFEERFFDDDRLCLYGMGEADGIYDERSTGAVVSRLIREASCVLELPVAGAGCLARHLDADGECKCRDIIRAIASADALICEDAHTVGLADVVREPSGVVSPLL